MSENRQELETLFVQTLSGHSFAVSRPALDSEQTFNALVSIIKSDGIMVAGEVRIPWHAIAFIARGAAAQTFLAAQQTRQPLAVAGMIPQGAA